MDTDNQYKDNKDNQNQDNNQDGTKVVSIFEKQKKKKRKRKKKDANPSLHTSPNPSSKDSSKNSSLTVEKNVRQGNKLFFEFSPQETINMIEALSLYKRLMIPNKYHYLVDSQLDNITEQLKLQDVDIYSAEDSTGMTVGDRLIIDDIYGHNNREGILLGSAQDEGFLRVIVVNLDNQLDIIEIPSALVKKEVEN